MWKKKSMVNHGRSSDLLKITQWCPTYTHSISISIPISCYHHRHRPYIGHSFPAQSPEVLALKFSLSSDASSKVRMWRCSSSWVPHTLLSCNVRPPATIAKLVQITPITMVYGTYNYSNNYSMVYGTYNYSYWMLLGLLLTNKHHWGPLLSWCQWWWTTHGSFLW